MRRRWLPGRGAARLQIATGPLGRGQPATTVYSSVLKRGLDVVGAVVLLVLCAPLAALVATAVVMVLGFPVFHREQRAGRGGRPITIVKFRSMTDDRDTDGALLADEARLGWLGKLLRRTSLDELPQLAAVITGDLSLVGPRPLPMRYLPRYSPRQATRLLVRPGLTGWAQVHGRNQVDWPGRLELDARYVEMSSRWYAPLIDGWIVLLTVFQVIRQALTGKGVAAEGHASMPEFFP